MANYKTALMSAIVLASLGATAVTSTTQADAASYKGQTTSVAKQKAADKQNLKKTKDGKQTRALDVYTKGTLTASGTAANGLDLQANNTVTTGVLNLSYDGESVGTALSEDSKYVVKVPKELQPLVASKDFKQYISGSYKCDITGGGTVNHTYTEDDISIATDGSTISFDNPQTTYLLGANYTINISLDLGQAVTDTGIRIADSTDVSNDYHFISAVVPSEGAIDWSLVGDYNAGVNLPTNKLDPGYDLLNQKPTIEKVTDKSTHVTGSGVPGAKITVKVGDKVIGTGTVDENGIYTVEIPTQSEGVTITVTQNTGVGESKPATTVVQHEDADIPAPVVNNPIKAGEPLTGLGSEPGDKITVVSANDQTKVLGTGYVEDDYTFSITLSDAPAGTIVGIYESNSNGDKSALAYAFIS
ncbi:Ig-like domain-containing protein [Levilactobacillus bambusae]|uniref:Bacterial Ig domain-containing protein n=1 Tax=Levilactobacillus bambusae TaxID=2024736 RepID=A0A2V1MXA4_9LACO|nr:Ig-like domain-containing protein [Levilactobacillus bambusae]PWF99646.1 hypothetical protein DCM90_07460 [Levilactobacillus bambusae]